MSNEKVIKKVLATLRSGSPTLVWNFLIKEEEHSPTVDKLAERVKEEFPGRAKEATRIVDEFIKSKHYEEFHKKVGPSVLKRAFNINFNNILDDFEVAVKENKK